jgi:hypothetical protein
MKRCVVVTALLASLSAHGSPGDPSPAPQVVAFNASVQVDVDATGKPVKVEAPGDLPQAIRSFIEKRVASWQYEPAKADGRPVPATTYVSVGACAIPVGEGYRLGLDFKGNGPGLVSDTGRMLPPSYPLSAQIAGVGGAYQVAYSIQPDGSARLDEVKQLEGTGGRYLKAFRDGLADWVAAMRYRPEMVNGKAVVTTMRFPVEFHVVESRGSHSQWRDAYAAQLRERAIASRECVAAATSGGPQPVAQDSAVKVIPTPAG